MNKYPETGDIIFINFGKGIGREIAKYRPAVVLSRNYYHHATGMVVVCPITKTAHPYGETEIYSCANVSGYANSWQITSLSYTERQGKIVAHVSDLELAHILDDYQQLLPQTLAV